MNKFYWLVKREFWEHRGGFLWAPVIATGVVLILNIMSLIAAEVAGGTNWSTNLLWQKLNEASPRDLRQMEFILTLDALVPGMVVCIVLFFVLFSYCMKNLSSDRSDRSILFWKSLPTSDLATVVSKAFSAVIVAPVIGAIVSIIGAILMLFILAVTGALHGASFGQVMFVLPHFGGILYAIGGLLPVFMVWMLPTVGWLMLCSAWSVGKTRRWAIGVPVALGVIISWLNLMGPLGNAARWYWTHVVVRILLGVLPGSWTWLEDPHGLALVFRARSDQPVSLHGMPRVLEGIVTSQYHLLLTPGFLWGALAGLVMIAMAVWLRRWRTEL